MTVKEFVFGYNKIVDSMKDKYIKDYLKITSYIPYIKKDVLTQNLVNITTYKYESINNDENTRKKTDIIRVNSSLQYLLFCRLIIENYTNLQVETSAFYEEYDLLKQSGLLNKLLIGTENKEPLIPIDEIAEIRTLIEMKQKDELTNFATPHSYFSNQINRYVELTEKVLSPILTELSSRIDSIDKNKLDKCLQVVDKIIKNKN